MKKIIEKNFFFRSSDLLEWQSSSGQVEFENGQFSVLENIGILDSSSYAPSWAVKVKKICFLFSFHFNDELAA